MLQEYAARMKRDWDDRARENAKWFINTVKLEQSDEEFEATGRYEVERGILSDWLLSSDRGLKSMRLLEIGCGIGRMTRHLAEIFGEVHGVDVSGEMIKQGRERLRNYPNIFLYETNGLDFGVLPSDYFDIVFSVYVFQHVPSADIIRSNIKDACRVLKPGGFFKFLTNGILDEEYESMQKDTWTGVAFPEPEIRQVARDSGAQLIRLTGAGRLYCGTTLRKPLSAVADSTETKVEIEYFARSDEPAERTIPTTGDGASLTLIISGPLPEQADANLICAEVAGHRVWPHFAGPVNPSFRVALAARGVSDSAGLIQVDFPISSDVPHGQASVRARLADSDFSAPVTVELLPPQPILPLVHFAANVVDGGIDIYAGGEKSCFRVFVYDLEKTACVDNVRLQVDLQMITPLSVSFIPSNGVYMVVAQLPKDIEPGDHRLSVTFGELESVAKPLRILPLPESTREEH